MNYQLQCEGFPLNEELRDDLLLCGRDLLLKSGKKNFVKIVVKQIDGMVQTRIEISLRGRKISALVRRADPIEATRAAVSALCKALDQDQTADSPRLRLTPANDMCPTLAL